MTAPDPPLYDATDTLARRVYELGTLGVTSIPGRRARGRPREGEGHVQHSVPEGDFETQARDHTIQFLDSGQINTTTLPSAKRQKLRPADLVGEYTAFNPLSDATGDSENPRPVPRIYDFGGGVEFVDEDGEDLFEEDIEVGDKRKRYQSSDNPMADWRPMIPHMLEETIRRHGLGNSATDPKCSACGDALSTSPHEQMATDEPIGTCEELYRCQDCGEFLECKTCLIRRHSIRHCITSGSGGMSAGRARLWARWVWCTNWDIKEDHALTLRKRRAS
ncbi:hypothetical protein BDZ89DRAFT_1142895 [Hymenopellis radicata]|nr:hypothetical protein BDZ89DRAFT_1142895 [Hymenopellis radicata]